MSHTEAQQEAWAPTPPDYHYWARRLAARQPWMAVERGRILGFIELENDERLINISMRKRLLDA